jgi:hypothetical protein
MNYSVGEGKIPDRVGDGAYVRLTGGLEGAVARLKLVLRSTLADPAGCASTSFERFVVNPSSPW